MATLTFSVPGKPVPQGGMRAFAKGNKAFVTHSKPKELGDYRARVALAANEAGAHIVGGPVHVEATFVFPRPKAHFGTGKNGETLKPSAPYSVVTKPDADKLLRSLLDALTGVCFVDDSQVVEVCVSKVYIATFTDPPRTAVRIYPMEEA